MAEALRLVALRLVADVGHAASLFDRDADAAFEAFEALVAEGLVCVDRDAAGKVTRYVVTAGGTKALAQAGLALDVAACAGYEAARARLAQRAIYAGEAWLDLAPAERMVIVRGARQALAGGPVPEGLLPTGFGLEPLFARVARAAFGEGS